MTDTLILNDDFSAATAVAWDGTKWGANNVGGGTVAQSGTGYGRITASASGAATKVTALTADLDHQDVILSIKRVSTNTATKFYLSPIGDYPSATAGSFLFNEGVWVEGPLASGPTLTLKAARNGVVTTGPTLAITLSSGSYTNMRLRKERNIFYVKTWAAGATEPTTWNVTWDMGSNGPVGGTGWRRPFIGVTSSTTGTQELDVDFIQAYAVSTDAGYTAEPMTASATSVQPAFAGAPKSKTVAATPFTASATTTDATIKFVNTIFPSRDLAIDRDEFAGSESTGGQYSAPLYVGGTYRSVIDFELPLSLKPQGIESATLKLTAGNSTAGTIKVRAITQEWNTNQATHTVGGSSVTAVVASNSVAVIDVSSLIGSQFYGFSITGESFDGSFYSRETPVVADKPTLSVTYHSVADMAASASASPVTASASMPDPVVTTTAGVSASASPMTATASVPSAVASVISNVSITAEPAVATAAMGDNGFAVPTVITATALTASVEALEATVSTQRGLRLSATPMGATALWLPPEFINGVPISANESEDKYFQRVMRLSPKTWYRLADRGSVADDRVGAVDGDYSGGVLVGQFNAPDNRPSVHFTGTGQIAQREPGGTNTDENTDYDSSGIPKTTLDFGFRTTKPTQFLMAGKDNFRNPVTGTTSDVPPREIALKGGKIVYRTYVWNYALGKVSSIGEVVGFQNLADGAWHDVSIRSNVYRNLELGLEIWIDGRMELRRVVTGTPASFAGFPDYVGGRPDGIDGYPMNPLPGSQWFEGDMSEIVWYDHLNSDHETTRLYYDFMGWSPIEANPVEAFAFTPDGSRGRGNQKRALVLYWYNVEDGYSIGGDGWNNKMNFNALAGQGDQFSGYKLFYRKVDLAPNGMPYRDKVTDAQTLIDLEYDVDINDYDVIMFKDWPDEGWELDQAEYYSPGAKERLLGQLRDANDKGIGLFVTQPRLAVDLGVIDRVEFVQTLREKKFLSAQGNAFGLYDYGSATKFPWNIAGDSGLEGWGGNGSRFNGEAMDTTPAYTANKAFFYGDTNKNDRFRVRALIDGLTDIPSYMINDAIYQKDYSNWGWSGVAYKYLHRLGGLQIGDEFIFHGTDFGLDYDAVSADFSDVRLGRWFGYYATPMSNVKAGTVVTTFGSRQWAGSQETDNPYKDYATTIVLRPGDVLAGRPVGGRIYVNFTEQPSRQPESVAVQKLPSGNTGFPSGYKAPDTTAQREWEYSFTRASLSTTTNPSTTTVNVVMPDGTIGSINVGAGGGSDLQMTRSSQLFPLEENMSWQMNRRGLWWLAQSVVVKPGDKTVVAEPMSGDAKVVNPSVNAQRDGGFTAAPMVALAELRKVKEDQSGDAENRTLPMTAEAAFTGFGKTITAAPMTAEVELIENFDMVHATGEQVVLTLHGVDATLYLKEEA